MSDNTTADSQEVLPEKDLDYFFKIISCLQDRNLKKILENN